MAPSLRDGIELVEKEFPGLAPYAGGADCKEGRDREGDDQDRIAGNEREKKTFIFEVP